MNKYPQLAKPPLREALIDLQLVEPLPSSFVDTLKERTLKGYDNVQPIRKGQFSLRFGPQLPAQATVEKEELFGRRYESRDKTSVVQIRRDGVTYSVLRGYTQWNEIQSAAQAIWKQYCEWAGPVKVGRLAVRYINVIELPPGVIDFDEYLTASPRVPPRLPQTVVNFLQRVVLRVSDAGTTAIVTQALEPPTQSHIPVVLDIDVFTPCSLEGQSSELWARLEKLRELKNMIFFSSVTDRALESYR